LREVGVVATGPDLETVRRELERRTTGDLVSILRNHDEDEWRTEVFEVVAALLEARGVSAAEVARLGPEGSDVMEAQDLITVARYFSPIEAHTYRMALEEAGIRAWVLDEDLGTMYGIAVGPRLQVRSEDLSAARAVLDSPACASALLPDGDEAS
jgi:hypothetical protein